MEAEGFQEPLACPTGLWQAPQVPGDPKDTEEQPWGEDGGARAGHWGEREVRIRLHG